MPNKDFESGEPPGAEASLRPDADSFDEKVKIFIESKNQSITDGKPIDYQRMWLDIEDLANGRQDPSEWQDYYPGWIKDDFEELLKKIPDPEFKKI